ncbi:hypothetical protein DRJ22_01020 [Candidatus Woesearchaeota archaeon]|nr:MAG: hypothetical protein B6U93_01660 [Candidatus Woesearchaeota archaeon ex4484_78]RLE46782.1 MAG: hypothetical protein DRJ22_01020 [Candidatus Woesearchaeota archaeon]
MAHEIWNPFEEINKIRKQIDKIMDAFWLKERELIKKTNMKIPSVDIENKKKEIEITADLPGIDKKDIEVYLDQNKIEIKARKKRETEIKKKNFHMQERSFNGFYRLFSLPALVDPEKATTSFKNGVLKIRIPKIKELPRKTKKLLIK